MQMPSIPPSAAEAVKIIEPRRGWLAVNWRELWLYRELLFFLTWRDVTVRYKQTVLGIVWAFVQPFLKMVVFTVIFGKVAKIDFGGNVPYAVGMFAGLLPWQFFSEALSRSSTSVVASSNLITKVYFPRLIVPLSSVGAGLVDFAISFTILVGLMLYYNVAPSAAILLVIPLVVLTIVAALGAGIFLSAMSVAYRDFHHLIPFGIQIWMYVTPVIYPVTILPPKWQWIVALNPMSGIVEAFRSAILGRPVDWVGLGVSTAAGAVLFVFGLYYFRRVENRFADIV